MSRRRFSRRVALGTAGALLGVGPAACGLFYYQVYRANAAVQTVPLPLQPPPAAGDRILVIAAHSDDETLGVGGTMAQAASAGARVRVVLLTNGDGFPLAAGLQYMRLRPSPQTYMDLARLRQQETGAALRELGLGAGAVTFLGYPDGGLSQLWRSHWSRARPYTSRFTGCCRSPYANSFQPRAPYCGESVVEDLTRIIEAERPTRLFVPHPGDDHPDHWATYCFATAALEGIRCRAEAARLVKNGRGGEGKRGRGEPRKPVEMPFGSSPLPLSHSSTLGSGDWLRRVEVLTYLVHRGDWPVPQGLHEEARLVPPANLLQLDTTWQEARIGAVDRQRKRAAIERYRSQVAVMGRFLRSFVRRDELFGRLPAAQLAPLGPVALGAGGFPLDWPASAVRMPEASGETLLRRLDGAVDLAGLEAMADGERVYLRLATRAPFSPRVAYRLYLHPLGGAPAEGGVPGAPMTVRLDHQNAPAGIRIEQSGSEWRIAVPRARLGWPQRLLVGAESRLAGVALDRLSWRVVVLPGA